MKIKESQLRDIIRKAICEEIVEKRNGFSSDWAAIEMGRIPTRRTSRKTTTNRNPDYINLTNELNMRFVELGKNTVNDPSIRAMHQFIRFTYLQPGKNTAGGAFLTWKNQFSGNNMIKYGEVYDRINSILKPIWDIRGIFGDSTIKGTFDRQALQKAVWYLEDLDKKLKLNINKILQNPVIVNDNSKFMDGDIHKGGHNVGFRQVLGQLAIDADNDYYLEIAKRIEDTINGNGNSSSIALEESQLEKIIAESIGKVLNKNKK